MAYWNQRLKMVCVAVFFYQILNADYCSLLVWSYFLSRSRRTCVRVAWLSAMSTMAK